MWGEGCFSLPVLKMAKLKDVDKSGGVLETFVPQESFMIDLLSLLLAQ